MALEDDVEVGVVRQDQVGVAGDHEVLGGDALPLEGGELAEQDPGVDDDAVADDVDDVGVQDPAGHEAHGEAALADDDRVPGVVAALVADDHVHVAGQDVGELALALVAPLGPDHDGRGHGALLLVSVPARDRATVVRARHRPAGDRQGGDVVRRFGLGLVGGVAHDEHAADRQTATEHEQEAGVDAAGAGAGQRCGWPWAPRRPPGRGCVGTAGADAGAGAASWWSPRSVVVVASVVGRAACCPLTCADPPGVAVAGSSSRKPPAMVRAPAASRDAPNFCLRLRSIGSSRGLCDAGHPMRDAGSQAPPAPHPTRTMALDPRLAALLAVTVGGAVPRALRLGAQDGFAWDEGYYVPAARAYLDGDLGPERRAPAPRQVGDRRPAIELLGDDPVGWRLAAVLAGIVTIPLTWLLVAAAARLAVVGDGGRRPRGHRRAADRAEPHRRCSTACCRRCSSAPPCASPCTSTGAAAGAPVGLAAGRRGAARRGGGGEVAGRRRCSLGALLAFAVPGRARPAGPGRRRGRLRRRARRRLRRQLRRALRRRAHARRAGSGSSGDMVDYHRGFRVDHAYDSSPRPGCAPAPGVRSGRRARRRARVAVTLALGNPALWWSFVASLPVLLATWWRGRDRTVELVLLAWATLHLSWLVVLRPGFLYYLAPLVPFMAVGVTWALRRAGRRWRGGALAGAVWRSRPPSPSRSTYRSGPTRTSPATGSTPCSSSTAGSSER